MADEALRVEGKTLYERGRWNEAVAKYGAYIELLLTDGESDGRLVVGYSNRAQSSLKLEMYADALGDTERALSLDTLHLKSLVRKAKALEGLKLYRYAVAVYTNLLDRSDLNANDARAIEDSLRVAGVKDRQTRLGQFEDIFSDWERKDKIEEFVGPVELKRVSGMDRGLFATRDVDPGELLFVSTTITSVRHPVDFEDRARLSLVSDLEKRVTHAGHNLKDFYQAQLLVQLDALAGPYPAGPLSRDIPPMRYFTPVNALAPHLRKLTSQDLRNPTFTTEFTWEMLLKIIRSREYTRAEGADECLLGIYCLASLINHSCLPNVTTLGESSGPGATRALFFRASRRIRKGDELFSYYCNIICPLHDRRGVCLGTICKCARCVLEERLLEEVPALRKLERRCSSFWDQRTSMMATREGERVRFRARCIESIKSVEQLLESNCKLQVLNATEKDWIRAAFIHFCKLLLEPALALSPSSSETDQLLQLCMIREAVRVLRTINPGSGVAMSMSSEAFRQTVAWLQINDSQHPIINNSPFESTWFAGQTAGSKEIARLMKKLYTEGMEIGRLKYGLKEQSLHGLFVFGGHLLLPAQHS